MTTGEKIRYFRIRKKLTQQELGEAIGIQGCGAGNRIAQYEAGYRVPKKERLDALAMVLDVSPEDLSVDNGKVWSKARCDDSGINAQTLVELNTMINALYRWSVLDCVNEEILQAAGIVPHELAEQLCKVRSLMFGDALNWEVLQRHLLDIEMEEERAENSR